MQSISPTYPEQTEPLDLSTKRVLTLELIPMISDSGVLRTTTETVRTVVPVTNYTEERTVEYLLDSNSSLSSSCTPLLSRARSEGSENKTNETENAPPLKHKDEKKNQCTQCGKSFSRSHNLKRHQLTHTQKKSHQCPQCGKSFSRSCDLKRHQLTHTQKKSHQCPQCGKSFSQACNLKRHQLVHTQEKPYSCSQCGQSFSQAVNLKRHERVHGRETGEGTSSQ